MLYPEIAREIIQMANEDQQMRKEYQQKRSLKKNVKWDESMDKLNTTKLQAIVEKIGWPSISKVGEEGSQAAWLLIQHADHDLVFQKQCLVMMQSLAIGDVKLANIAYLTDRILTSEKKLQKYGTQFFKDDDGKMKPRPIDDMQNLDQRRFEMGLESFNSYKANFE